MNDQEFLEHFGIKGMKRGKRKLEDIGDKIGDVGDTIGDKVQDAATAWNKRAEIIQTKSELKKTKKALDKLTRDYYSVEYNGPQVSKKDRAEYAEVYATWSRLYQKKIEALEAKLKSLNHIYEELSKEDSLTHYGVLGMRWGIRKDRRTGARGRIFRAKTQVAEKTNQESSGSSGSTSTNSTALRQKSIYEMSDSELQALTKRLQLEKQYRDLTGQEVSRGQKFVKEVFGASAKNSATNVVTKVMTEQLEKIVKRVEPTG